MSIILRAKHIPQINAIIQKHKYDVQKNDSCTMYIFDDDRISIVVDKYIHSYEGTQYKGVRKFGIAVAMELVMNNIKYVHLYIPQVAKYNPNDLCVVTPPSTKYGWIHSAVICLWHMKWYDCVMQLYPTEIGFILRTENAYVCCSIDNISMTQGHIRSQNIVQEFDKPHFGIYYNPASELDINHIKIAEKHFNATKISLPTYLRGKKYNVIVFDPDDLDNTIRQITNIVYPPSSLTYRDALYDVLVRTID